MVLALTAAVLSIIVVAITGFYPGIIVLLLMALVAFVIVHDRVLNDCC